METELKTLEKKMKKAARKNYMKSVYYIFAAIVWLGIDILQFMATDSIVFFVIGILIDIFLFFVAFRLIVQTMKIKREYRNKIH